MAVTITVAGTDRTAASKFESLSVINSIASKADSAELVFTTTGDWRPQAGNSVVVTNGASTEFAGVIMEVVEDAPTLTRLHYTCSLRDYVHLLDRTLVTQNYSAQLGSDIVKDIVATYTSGFTSSGVQKSASVASQIYDYVYPSDAIQSLANVLGWAWNVTYDKDVQFFDALTQLAPSTTINIDVDTTTYGELSLKESAEQIHNRVYLKGFPVKSSNTYVTTFKGDGTTKFFLLGYEPGSTSAADISVNRAAAGTTGNLQRINVDMIDGSPDNAVGAADDVFVCYDNKGLRYDVAPASSDVITATYTFMRDLPTMMEDTVAQSTAATREGGSGIHEFVVNDPGLRANDGTDLLAQQRGQSILTRYAFPRFQGKFTSFIQGWKAGQSFTLTSTKRMGGFTKTVYVQQVTKRLVNHPSGGTPTLKYIVEFSDQQLAF